MKTSNKTKMPKLYKFGQKSVILDRDLANYLSVETKRIRETIKRNRNTFPIGSVLCSTSKISYISPRKEVREQSPSDLSATFFDFSATFCDPEKRIEKQSTNILFALDKEGILFLSSKRVGAALSLSLSTLASFMDSSEEKRDKLLFPSSVSAKDITKSIHHIRNEFVILDEDLAIYYHSTVKRVNEQVKGTL